MIVPQENDASKVPAKGAINEVEVNRAEEADPPPTYDQADGQVASGSTLPSQVQVVPDIKPSNFVRVQRMNGSVKGAWIVDPILSIPEAFLPPLNEDETEETRKNIWLDSKNGSIDADIYIMRNDAAGSVKRAATRVLIHTLSRNGSVTTRLHDIPAQSPAVQTRLPVHIDSFSSNGSVNVYLPRSFRGPLRLKTKNGSVKFSDAVQSELTPFSELDGVQRSFIGPFDHAEFESGGEWAGDELTAGTLNGSIRVYYEDEEKLVAAKKQAMTFFERLRYSFS